MKHLLLLLVLILGANAVLAEELEFNKGTFVLGKVLTITAYAEINKLDYNLSKQTNYVIDGVLLKQEDNVWKYSSIINKPDTSLSASTTPTKLGWKIASIEPLLVDMNVEQRYVWGETFSIDFQDLKDSGFTVIMKQTGNDVIVYVAGDFKGTRIVLDPQVRTMPDANVFKNFTSSENANSKFVFRDDQNVLRVYTKDSNFYWLPIATNTFSKITVGTPAWTVPTYLGNSLTKIKDSNRLIVSFFPSNAGGSIATCRLSTNVACDNNLQWGVGAKVLAWTGFSDVDNNGTHLIDFNYYTAKLYFMDATKYDGNKSNDWNIGSLAFWTVGVMSDGVNLSVRGSYIWVINQWSQARAYSTLSNTITGTYDLNKVYWRLLRTDDGNFTTATKYSGQLVYANNNMLDNNLFVAEINTNGTIARVETIVGVQSHMGKSITLSDKNIYVLYNTDANLLYYITKGFSDANYSKPMFVQSNCSRVSSSKDVNWGYLDYACFNNVTKTVDTNWLSFPVASVVSTCIPPAKNNDWVINESCHLSSNVDIGTGTLYLTSLGSLTIDNAVVNLRKVNIQGNGTTRTTINCKSTGSCLNYS